MERSLLITVRATTISENPDEEKIIHGALNISTDPFNLEEYRKAKTSIEERKACDDDNVAPKN